jgi:hypothetical protein
VVDCFEYTAVDSLLGGSAWNHGGSDDISLVKAGIGRIKDAAIRERLPPTTRTSNGYGSHRCRWPGRAAARCANRATVWLANDGCGTDPIEECAVICSATIQSALKAREFTFESWLDFLTPNGQTNFRMETSLAVLAVHGASKAPDSHPIGMP